MYKLLLLGPRVRIDNPKIIGGTVVLFEQLISDLKKEDVEIEVINTNIKKSFINIYFSYLFILLKVIVKVKKYDHISLHGSTRGFVYLGFGVALISKIFNIKASMRKFAGDFAEVYKSSGFISGLLIKFVLKYSDIIFFETKSQLKYFSKFNKNIFWFPNVRRRKLYPKIPRYFNKKYIYIGQLKKTKGIEEILKVSTLLEKDYLIDIFGPIVDEEYGKEYFDNFNVNYKGALRFEEVIEKLNNYDILLLPTYYEGEGYPGIIVEAYSLGIPVITTRWKAIPEIVDDYITGILIKPNNVLELKNAIEYFNEDNYNELSRNAYNIFDYFDSEKRTKLFLNDIFKNL